VKLNWNFIRRFIIKGQKLNVCFLWLSESMGILFCRKVLRVKRKN
jgi:hypothetical protein